MYNQYDEGFFPDYLYYNNSRDKITGLWNFVTNDYFDDIRFYAGNEKLFIELYNAIIDTTVARFKQPLCIDTRLGKVNVDFLKYIKTDKNVVSNKDYRLRFNVLMQSFINKFGFEKSYIDNMHMAVTLGDFGAVIVDDKVFFNIDDDILQWLVDFRQKYKIRDYMLFSMATGFGMDYIFNGLTYETLLYYIDAAKSYYLIMDLIGGNTSLTYYVTTKIKDYKDKNEHFFIQDKFDKFKGTTRSMMSIKVTENGMPISLALKSVNDTLSNNSNRNRKTYGSQIDLDKISDIIKSSKKYNNIEPDNLYVSKEDIEEAKEFIIEAAEYEMTHHIKQCNKVDKLCYFLNINAKSLIGKLCNDMNLVTAIILCVAEKIRYKQGYFDYDYCNLEDIQKNKFSTKEILREVIEKELKWEL